MKHLQKFNEYEVNEGAKNWLLAGLISLASLNPSKAEELKSEIENRMESVEKKSGDEILTAKGKDIKKELQKLEIVKGSMAKGDVPVEGYFKDRETYSYVLIVGVGSKKQALDKAVEMFNQKGIVKLFVVQVGDSEWIVYGEKLPMK